MKHIVNLLFQARILKALPRSGYHFLGAGKESVAEHVYMTAFIAWVLSRMVPEVDSLRLISMALLHDLPEARTGDLNYVQKKYLLAEEEKAIADTFRGLPFADGAIELLAELDAGETEEAKLARDADQLALIIDLKGLSDIGFTPPGKWLPPVLERLRTEAGKRLAQSVLETESDGWWLKELDNAR
jgi:putative hydrolase of HD superfamily